MLAVMGVRFSTLGQPNPVPFTAENAQTVIYVDQWLTHLAVVSLMCGSESGLNSGHNDDYYMYRGVTDPRFILLFHDLDQLFGQGGQAYPANDTIWGATFIQGFPNGRNSQTAWYYDQVTGRSGCYQSCHFKSHNPLQYTP